MTTRHSRCGTLLGLVMALSAGCGTGDQTGVPQPVPIPKSSQLRATGSDNVGEIDVFGLPGAVSAAGRVEVRGPNGSASARSTDAGTFFTMVAARLGDVLSVTWEGSQPVTITVGSKEGTTQGVPEAAVDKVAGDLLTLTVTVVAGLEYIVANTNTGDVVIEAADAAGALTFTIRASSGDELRLYTDVGDAANGGSLAEPTVLVVP
ncbi:MAG: hypothetical protein KC503_08855 [Myxococcales bacterium]|nr:hypothetical protein [Myxococcales bacterium]